MITNRSRAAAARIIYVGHTEDREPPAEPKSLAMRTKYWQWIKVILYLQWIKVFIYWQWIKVIIYLQWIEVIIYLQWIKGIYMYIVAVDLKECLEMLEGDGQCRRKVCDPIH